MPTLEWIGKEKVINHHQQVPYRVLEGKYTYNAEKSDNMIIHGDNLEALKALLPVYEGRVKCIYIDPPYNTGNEGWIYNDNVNDPKIRKWLGEVVGREGEDLSRHDKWLCMMYPRLKLLQRLLADDGAIFISIDDLEKVIKFIKNLDSNIIIMIDNCYCEFVSDREPIEVGADLVVGSLIKNPGGGIAPIGGYICGTKECVENAATRLITPGLGREVGASLGITAQFAQGLFLAPTVTASAVKGAIFAASVFEKLGYAALPNSTEDRFDIIEAVTFGKPELIQAFCEGIQAASPVDSYVKPVPWAMPGYDSDVIMAAGTFVSGASIELSADAPMKEPYAVYFQGGLTYPHAKYGIMLALQKMVDKNLVVW